MDDLCILRWRLERSDCRGGISVRERSLRSRRLDGYVVLNAALIYRLEHWRMSLNLNNITDEEYIRGAPYRTDVDVTPGAPFSAVVSVTYAF